MIEIKRIQQQPDLAQAIYAVMAAVYPVSPWTLEQIQADLAQDQTWYAMAYDGAEVIGFLAVQENIFEAEVLQIAVKGDYQGQGIVCSIADRQGDFPRSQKVKSTSASILQERKDGSHRRAKGLLP